MRAWGKFAGDCCSDADRGLEAYFAAEGVDGVFDNGEAQAGPFADPLVVALA